MKKLLLIKSPLLIFNGISTRKTFFLVFIFLSCYSYSQENFSKTYDPFENENQSLDNINSINDNSFILSGLSSCRNQTMLCHNFIKVDSKGEVLDKKENRSLSPGRFDYLTKDNTLLVCGTKYNTNSEFQIDSVYLLLLSPDGDSITSNTYKSENQNEFAYYPWGVVEVQSQYVIYGQVDEYLEESQRNQTKGFFMWINQDLSLDTITYISPELSWMFIADVDVFNDNELYIYYDTNTYNGILVLDKKIISKYDIEKKYSQIWESPFISTTNRGNCISVLDDDNILIDYIDEKLNNSRSTILSIDKNGTINWEHRVDTRYTYDFTSIFDIKAVNSDSIIIVGEYNYLYDNIFVGGFTSLLDSKNGEAISEKVHLDWSNPNIPMSNIPSPIISAHILESDQILFLGQKSVPVVANTFQEDIWLLKTDKSLCLESECGGFYQHTDEMPPKFKFLNPLSTWITYDETAISKKIKYKMLPISTSKASLESTELFLDLDSIFYELPRDILIEEEDQKVYLERNGNKEILYDFNLEYGDNFITGLIPDTLEVIELGEFVFDNGKKNNFIKLASTKDLSLDVTWVEQMGALSGIIWTDDFYNNNCDKYILEYYRRNTLQWTKGEEDCILDSADDIGLSSNLLVFPNPTVGDFYISLSRLDMDIEHIKLYDTNGRLINKSLLTKNQTQIYIDALENEPTGIYLISITCTNGDSLLKRIIKQ